MTVSPFGAALLHFFLIHIIFQSITQIIVLTFDKFCVCAPTHLKSVKIFEEKFGGLGKMIYLCIVILKTIFLP